MWSNSTDSYGTFTKLLHWTMAIIIISLMIVGLYMTGLDDEDPSRRDLYHLHKVFGLMIIFLSVFVLAGYSFHAPLNYRQASKPMR